MKQWFFVTLLLSLTACTTSPTGRTQLIVMPDAQMNAMGAASFTQLKDQSRLDTKPEHISYVRCISDSLLTTMGEDPKQWAVEIFMDDSLNAFALPGKKIGVHSGMIEFASADELAAVIGHEIGHVLARHGAERMSMGVISQVGMVAANAALKDEKYHQEMMVALGVGSQVGVILPYSRSHESEADAMGLAYMAKAGFNPKAAVSLWQKMQAKSEGSSPEFMSTHPSNKTRIDQLGKQLPSVNSLYQQAKKQHCKKPKAYL